MKRTGSIILMAVVLAAAPLAAAGLRTELDSGTVPAGSATTLRVRVSPGARLVSLPRVPGLTLSYSGVKTNMTIINGNVSHSSEVTFLVEAHKPGRFTIPAISFEHEGRRVKSQPAVLIVTAGRSGAGEEAASSPAIKPSVELSRQKAYLGQPVILRYYLRASDRVQVNGFQSPVETKGFAVHRFDPREIKPAGEEAGREPLVVQALIPLAAGRHSVGGGTLVITTMEGDGLFAMPAQRHVEFEKRTLEVVAPPSAGKPEDFRGDAGDFTMEAEFSSSAVNAYDEKKISVRIKGSGNFITLARPSFAEVPAGCKVLFEDGAPEISLKGDRLTGEKKYSIIIIPEKPGRLDLGPLRLSYFNPDTGSYRTAQTAPVSFEVKPGKGGPAQSAGEEREQGPDFNPLYIALAALLVAGAVVFVVIWERRRYSGLVNGSGEKASSGEEPAAVRETNPLVELSRAARSGDQGAFLKAADRALDRARGSADEGRVHPLREQIQACRFGGAKLTREEMSRIEEGIRALLKDGS